MAINKSGNSNIKIFGHLWGNVALILTILFFAANSNPAIAADDDDAKADPLANHGAGIGCRPFYTMNADDCHKMIDRCDPKGIFMKWTGLGCIYQSGKLKGQRMRDGGCQCEKYCGYHCKHACNSDPGCKWMFKKGCVHKDTGLPGKAMGVCPTSAPSRSPTIRTFSPSIAPITSKPSISPHAKITSKPSVSPSTTPTQHLVVKNMTLYKQKVTWFQAETLCTQKGGRLATIKNAQEQATVTALINANYNPAEWGSDWPYLYLGAKRVTPGNANWDWIDGTPMRRGTTNIGFSNWDTGEPNNGGSEDCLSAFLTHNGYWNDIYCYGSGYYICEFIISS